MLAGIEAQCKAQGKFIVGSTSSLIPPFVFLRRKRWTYGIYPDANYEK